MDRPGTLEHHAGSDLGGDNDPQVTTDGAGNWVAVWESWDSLGGTIGGNSDVLVSRSTDAGGTWTAPAPLNTNAGSDFGDDAFPQVTTDGAGNWVAVWESYDSLGGAIPTHSNDWDIFVSRSADAGATWSALAPLNTNAGSDFEDDDHPQITTDGAGNWVAVWGSSDGLSGTISTDNDILFATFSEILNLRPVLDSIGNKSIDEQTQLTFTATATDADVPADTLTFSLDAGAPAGASVDPATGLFTWTPTEAQGPGSYPITVRVTDDGAPVLDDFEIITISVNEVNLPPVLGPIGDKSIDELTELTFTATATDPDVPANTLTFSLDTGAPAGASIDPLTGLFTWTPTEAQGPASYPITVRVTDDGTGNLWDSETITVTVNDGVQPPVLGPIGNKTIDEQTELTFTATATDADVPADTLTFSLDAGAPAGASIDPLTGLFTWTPTEAQRPGSYPITVRVTDNGTPVLDDFEIITIGVNELNLPPVLDSIGNKSIDQQTELTFTATATDADLPANTLTFSLDAGAPAGASIVPATGLFTWTPAEAQGPGSYPITVRVTDDGTGNLWDSESITVTVNDDVTDLGTLGLVEKSGLDPSTGDLWYRVEMMNGGILTAEAFFQGDGDSVQLAIYDAAQTDPPLATSALVDGGRRVDLAGASAGQTYFVKVSGSNTDVDLRVANLLDHQGTTVTVHGTDGDDTFGFNAFPSRLITINGVEYHFDAVEVRSVTFDGQAGYDVVTLRDSAGDETLTAEPGSVTFAENAGLFIVQATGFEELQAYAKAGGTDKAILHGSEASDKYKSYEEFVRLRAKNSVYSLRAKEFDSVVGDVGTAGNDIAIFNGTDGDETFTYDGAQNTARFEGTHRDHTAVGFTTIIARAGKGSADVANFTDVPGEGPRVDDVFYFKSHKTELVGQDVTVTARAFDEVHAEASESGFDVARIYDTTGDDHFEFAGDVARLYRRVGTELDLLYETIGFERVKAYRSEGDDTKDEQDHSFELHLYAL